MAQYLRTSGLLLAVALLRPATSAASELRTDFYLSIPKTTLGTLATEVKGTYSRVFESLTIPGDFPALLNNTRLQFDYQVRSLQTEKGKRFAAVVAIPSAQAQIAGFHVDSLVIREVDGVKVKAHLKIDCANLVLQAKRSFAMTMTGQIQNPLAVVIEQVAVPADPDLWTVRADQCVGPTGVAEYLTTQVNQLWREDSDLRRSIIIELNKKIQSWIASHTSLNYNFAKMNAIMFLKAEEVLDAPTHLNIRLRADISTSKNCPIFNQTGTLAPATLTTLSQGTRLLLPAKLARLWTQCLHEMGSFFRRDYSRNLTAFKNFRNSLAASVVWPDLTRFSKSTEFVFNTVTDEKFVLYPRPPTAARTLSYSLRTNVLTTMRRLSDQTEIPYVTFGGPMEALVAVTLKPGKFASPGQLSFVVQGDVTLDLRHRFDAPKSEISNPLIDLDKIEPEIAQTIKSQGFSYPIAPFELNKSRQLHMNGLETQDDSIQIPLILLKQTGT